MKKDQYYETVARKLGGAKRFFLLNPSGTYTVENERGEVGEFDSYPDLERFLAGVEK